MKHDFHILIVGGGMVGACVAALAAANPHLADLRISVLESQPPATPPPADAGAIDLRVSPLSRASERILAASGAWPLIPPQFLSAYEDMVVWDAAGRARGRGSIHFSASRTGEPDLGHIVENRRVLWALYDSPPFRRRVTVLRGELEGVLIDDGQSIVSLTDGPYSKVRSLSSHSLARIAPKDPAVRDALTKRLGEETHGVTTVDLAWTLALCGDRSGVGKIRNLLFRGDTEFVRGEAAIALGEIGEAGDVPLLDKALREDRKGLVRNEAYKALEELNKKS